MIVSPVMLKDFPTSVEVPFQALVDDALLEPERITLAFLYAISSDAGIVNATPVTMAKPRGLHRNSVRRHMYRLEELKYVVSINREPQVLEPKRERIEGYALTLHRDGKRNDLTRVRGRIGGADWRQKGRWA